MNRLLRLLLTFCISATVAYCILYGNTPAAEAFSWKRLLLSTILVEGCFLLNMRIYLNNFNFLKPAA